ncbi:A24 family peptidase [Pseudomonadales bacterium]|nr:A24 family peptidase [Pseudomonadales bacterium]
MIDQLHLLHELYPILAASIDLTFGLLIGSFLNVVITRLPLMLEQQWQQEAHFVLALEPAEPASMPLSLSRPRSRCPNCLTQISAHHNIPVLSYLFLRGRCNHCAERISPEYPLVELAAGAATVFLIQHFGFTANAGLACLFTYALITLAMIDFRTTLLPDSITLSFLWLGILANLNDGFTDLTSAVIGAMAGYLSLWLVYWGFKLATGKDGMGFGDFKLFAMLGAWLGWQLLPIVILLSSFTGALIGLTLIALGRSKDHPIPFGPYLAIAGWLALIWGDDITLQYFQLINLA